MAPSPAPQSSALSAEPGYRMAILLLDMPDSDAPAPQLRLGLTTADLADMYRKIVLLIVWIAPRARTASQSKAAFPRWKLGTGAPVMMLRTTSSMSKDPINGSEETGR